MNTSNMNKNICSFKPKVGRKECIMLYSNKIDYPCPWGKAPCGRDREIVHSVGCAGCPAFNEKEFKEIMNSAAEEEAQWTKWKEERRRELLDENFFGPLENQW